MLNIFVCENDTAQRSMLVDHIESTLEELAIQGKVVLATGEPEELLLYVKENAKKPSLYFIEIEFENAINGILLATEIRHHDRRCVIAFVTARLEMMSVIFEHYVEAIAFILKTDQAILKRKIENCIKIAHERLHSDDGSALTFKAGWKDVTEKLENIISFEKDEENPHKVIMHTEDGQQSFYASLNEIEDMDDSFFRCHRKTIVNIKSVKEVQACGSIVMKDGSICLGSTRKIKELILLLG